MPIARLGPDEVVTDSSAIVDRIAALLRQGNAAPAKQLDAFFSPDAARWAAWADMELAVLLFPNITRSFAESFQAFSYVQVRRCGLVGWVGVVGWVWVALLARVVLASCLFVYTPFNPQTPPIKIKTRTCRTSGCWTS